MSDNKKYYWLKLDQNFFEDDTIQWLEDQKNGKDYVIFYLKLMLKSLKDDGSLIRYVGERLIPYDVSALSKLTSTNEDTVAVAMKAFVDIGLVEVKETGEIYMSQLSEMVGTETQAAQRMRRMRARNNDVELIEIKENNVAKRNNVQESYGDVQKCYTEIEIEKELETEIELEEVRSPAKAEPDVPYKKIIDCLNEKSGRSFRHTTDKTKRLIKARWNDGFILEDFDKVIDIKVSQWKNDPSMAKFLRPETLFGPKFEGYLNEQHDNAGNERNWEEWDFLD